MKRIELVIMPWMLDAFQGVAPKLGISEFDTVEVYRSGCATVEGSHGLSSGYGPSADLAPRLKLEFELFDNDVPPTLRRLIELIHPEIIAVFKLEHTVRPAKDSSTSLPPLRRTTNRSAGAALQLATRRHSIN